MRKFIVLTLYVCSSTVCAYTQPAGPAAAPSQAHYFSFGVFYDQDYTLEMLGLSNLNEDRNYTMGLGLFYSSDQLAKSPFFAPHKLLNRIFNHKEKFRTGATLTQQPSYAFMLADGAFTPDSLPAYYVIKNDRPYGSLTYIQTVISNPAFERYRNYTSTFSIGLLGIPVSREVQTYIHKKMNDNDTKNPRTPRGWGNQISNGGELTLAYRYAKEFLLTKKYINSLMPEKSVGAEFKHGYSYSVGYYTYFAYEMDMRLGLFDANNWTYTVSPLGGSDKSTGQIQNYARQKKPTEFYLLLSVRPVFMLYNALLNGQFRKSVHTLSFTDMRHLICEFNGGVGFSVGIGKQHAIDLKAKFSGRSPEFSLPGRDPRFHFWGGIDLIYSHFK